MKAFSKMAGVGIGVTAAVLLAGGPANAAAYKYEVSCKIPGAQGYVHYGTDSSTKISVRVGVYDSSADGHHPQARLLTKNNSGEIVYYSWHSDLDGANNGWLAWDTYATDSNGISDVGVQVGNYEGDQPLDSCSDWDASVFN
ncbi:MULTISPECIES: hypothetical protein [unclassified Streptomyces]|uniref:hypothetical protein n=1 Tax=unclassified Streptomyces TaxID=2593676 RepID=UPI0036E98137